MSKTFVDSLLPPPSPPLSYIPFPISVSVSPSLTVGAVCVAVFCLSWKGFPEKRSELWWCAYNEVIKSDAAGRKSILSSVLFFFFLFSHWTINIGGRAERDNSHNKEKGIKINNGKIAGIFWEGSRGRSLLRKRLFPGRVADSFFFPVPTMRWC